MNWILEPWPWYVSGPLLAGVMFLLILLDKQFGMSANLRTMCTISGAGKKASFFDFDWRTQRWNLFVLVGSVIGGFVAAHFLSPNDAVAISPETISILENYGIASAGETYLPTELFGMEAFGSMKSLAILLVGGLLIGFGARYAGGCTSGHAISGLSNLQFPSLIAVIGFFVGGLMMVHLVFPLIF